MYKGNQVVILTAVIFVCLLFSAQKTFAAFVITPDKTDQINKTLVPPPNWQKKNYAILAISVEKNRIDLKAGSEKAPFHIFVIHEPEEKSTTTLDCIGQLAEEVSLCLSEQKKQFKPHTEKYFHWLKLNSNQNTISSWWTKIEEKVAKPDEKPLDKEYFAKLTIEQKARFKDPVIKAKPVETKVWWAWFSVIGIFLLVAIIILVPYFKDRKTYIAGLQIAVAAFLTRAFVPDTLLHMQTDDLNLVATARGLTTLVNTHSTSGTLLGSIRFLFDLWGENLQSVFLASHLFGAILPLMAYVLTFEWFKDRQLALTCSILLLVSPVGIAYSAAITPYVPMAAIFSIVFFMGLLVLRLPLGKSFLLVPLITLFLFYVSLLKEEFILLIPAYFVLVTGFYYYYEDQNRNLKRLIFSLFPIILITGLFFISEDLFLTEVNQQIKERSGRLLSQYISAPIFYYACFLFINPPFLPFKLSMLMSVTKKETRNVLPLVIVTMMLASIYMLSNKSFGFNQWRHSLIFLIPLYMAATPQVFSWWREKGEVRFARIMIIAIILMNLMGYFAYGQKTINLKQQGFNYIQKREYDPEALIIYAPLEDDMTPKNLLLATGKADVIALDNLFPASCDFGMLIRKIPIRQFMVSSIKSWMKEGYTYFEKPSTPEHFYHTENLEKDLKWLKEKFPEMPDWFEQRYISANFSIFAIEEIGDEYRCAKHKKKIKSILSQYKKIYFFFDSAMIDDNENLSGKFRENFMEYARITEKYVILEQKPLFTTPELILVKMILDPECIKGVKSSDDCIIWSMK